MKTRIITLLTLATLAVCAADSQRLIPFQGRLTNQQGVPYTEGRYTIVFNLYDAPVGGAALWTERHESVGLINGMVNVFLGSITDLSGQDFSKMRYLGITIDADGNANTPDPEMVPRQMIIPAFYAKDSEKLQGADWSAILANGSTDPRTGYINGTRLANAAVTSEKIKDGAILPSHLSATILPTGVILPFAGLIDNVPVGWLPCDGRALSPSDYPKLFEAIGTTWGMVTNSLGAIVEFKIPDFRNRTLWGAGRNDLGTYVEPGLPNVTGQFFTHNGSFSGGNSAFYVAQNTGMSVGCVLYGTYVSGLGFDASRCSPIYGASDTVQPPAAVVNFIIKVDQPQ